MKIYCPENFKVNYRSSSRTGSSSFYHAPCPALQHSTKNSDGGGELFLVLFTFCGVTFSSVQFSSFHFSSEERGKKNQDKKAERGSLFAASKCDQVGAWNVFPT